MESTLRGSDLSNVEIIETLGYHPGEGPRRGERHLARLGRSAAALGFVFDHAAAKARLAAVRADHALRCRLTLTPDGTLTLTTSPYRKTNPPWRLEIAQERLDSAAPWLCHKTTRRAFYDSARAALPSGVDEIIFFNENDNLCEGTITNIFVDCGPGPLLTPALEHGLLAGILRQEMLERGEARSATLSRQDLRGARAVFVGNSLRGLIPARLA